MGTACTRLVAFRIGQSCGIIIMTRGASGGSGGRGRADRCCCPLGRQDPSSGELAIFELHVFRRANVGRARQRARSGLPSPWSWSRPRRWLRPPSTRTGRGAHPPTGASAIPSGRASATLLMTAQGARACPPCSCLPGKCGERATGRRRSRRRLGDYLAIYSRPLHPSQGYPFPAPEANRSRRRTHLLLARP